jgi:hypothetical protein
VKGVGRRLATLGLAGTLSSVSPRSDAPAPAWRGRRELRLPAHGLNHQGSNTPKLTILYQNFPNPFPTASSTITCIWFDLDRPSHVRLSIYDIRGNLIRTLVPSSLLSDAFPAGQFGRGSLGPGQGCDPRFSWDGRGNEGRYVTTGVYLLRLTTESFHGTKKIAFRGR